MSPDPKSPDAGSPDAGSPDGVAGGWRRPRHLPGLPLAIGAIEVIGTNFAAAHAATQGGGGGGGGGAHQRLLDDSGYALLVLGALALLLRRPLPPVALVGALLPTAVYFAVGYPYGPGFLAAIVAVLAGIQAGWRRFTWTAVAVAYVGYAVAAVILGTANTGQLVTVGVWSIVTVGFAEASRLRRERFAEMALARAEAQRTTAERRRTVQEQERRQASEERLRIAQELHDVIGHHLTLINVQAGVGLHLMDEQPEQARAALSAIKHASAEALRETRGVLAALRPAEQSVPLAPAPGLADVDALVAEVNAAGFAVEVRRAPLLPPLPPQVDRAAYRIVQEALTNVRRHAGPGATATVSMAYESNALTVRVLDNGRGADTAGEPGNGIVGMRERALALGGEVIAGPRAEGGFQVVATLPVATVPPPPVAPVPTLLVAPVATPEDGR